MGLLDELASPPKRLTPCAVRNITETLDKADADILIAAVNNPEWPIKTLSDALRGKGLMIGQTPIKAHRNKICSCFDA